MDARSLRARLAGGAALVLLATGLLATPATADDPTLTVVVGAGGVEFMDEFGSGPEQPWTTSVTVEVFSAASSLAPLATATKTSEDLSGGFAFTLPEGDYRLRASADGWMPGWYTGEAHDDAIYSLLDLYGWNPASTFDTATIVHVDAGSATDHQDPAIMLFRSGSGAYGVVARWSDANWNPDEMWPDGTVIYAELVPAGGGAPVATMRTSSSAYAFDDVAPGEYTVRATIGQAPEGTEPGGPGDLVDTEVWWYPGTQDAARAGTFTVESGGGHFVAANVATDTAPMEGEAAVISGDLYAGGFATVALPSEYEGFFGLNADAVEVETYEWFLDGEPIAGAYSSTLAIPAGSEGQELSASIDVNFLPAAMRFTYRAAFTVEAPTGNVFTAGVPTVAGQAILGRTLTAQPGTWTPAGTKSFQWYRDGVAIAGEVTRQHILVEEDLGTALTVTITGTKPGYMPAHRTSAPIPVDPAPFAAAPVPTIKGAARYGTELTVGGGTWRPQPVDVTYQWFRDGVPIDGATDAVYTLGADDVGAAISVATTGSKAGYLTAARLSAPTTPVALAKIVAPKPDLIGQPTVNSTLSIDTSAWTPAGATIAYEWQRNGGGNGFLTVATTPTYTLTDADRNKKIRLVVTVSSPGYETLQRTTAATVNITP
ncbi:hypothetical protein GCM10009775_36040 [Microbacterium aoyamense]|uniref:Carboxypeptidase regulatory-like domain-containing protein n=1 Tax=Microbacterium aoyamense TaxID=344166 RepID=A0ABP5BCW0_9MICO|nr:hypothetical protein [Microbacterium aoyamense]